MKKVALIIGHNHKAKGAYSKILGYEYDYWRDIALKIKTKVPELVEIYERQPNKSYGAEMRVLTSELNKNNYEFCIELHFNSSASNKANGSECLVYAKNEKAKQLATNFLTKLQSKFASKIRGNQGLVLINDRNIRGAIGILTSKDTYILTEPFFGSNDTEASKFSLKEDVADLYINFIKENI